MQMDYASARAATRRPGSTTAQRTTHAGRTTPGACRSVTSTRAKFASPTPASYGRTATAWPQSASRTTATTGRVAPMKARSSSQWPAGRGTTAHEAEPPDEPHAAGSSRRSGCRVGPCADAWLSGGTELRCPIRLRRLPFTPPFRSSGRSRKLSELVAWRDRSNPHARHRSRPVPFAPLHLPLQRQPESVLRPRRSECQGSRHGLLLLAREPVCSCGDRRRALQCGRARVGERRDGRRPALRRRRRQRHSRARAGQGRMAAGSARPQRLLPRSAGRQLRPDGPIRNNARGRDDPASRHPDRQQDRLEAQQSPDALDRLEVVVLPHRPGRAAVGQGSLEREVEPVVAPAFELLALATCPRLLEDRLHDGEQFGRPRVRLGLRPADDRALDLLREQPRELGARLLRGDDDDVRARASLQGVELLGDAAQVAEDEVLDVSLVARLRPAALVVPARLLLRAVDDLLEPAGAQSEELAALPADDGHDRAVAAPDERSERRQAERRPDADRVANRLRQQQGPPDAVEPGAEEGEALRAVAVEVGLEEASDALEVGLEPFP